MDSEKKVIKRIRSLLKKRAVKISIGLLLGAAAGYLYYRFIGCRTGSCGITSSPVVSTIFGALTGLAVTAW
jgi:hypothetical protein